MPKLHLLQTPETYEIGAPFDKVRVKGVLCGTVVMAYDLINKSGAVGLFMNPSESGAVEQMLGELNQAGFSVGGLELTLAGLYAEPGANDPISQQMRQSRAYITSVLTNSGVPPARIRQRYSNSSGLASVTVNLRTSRLVVWTASSAVKASMRQSERMRGLLPRANAAGEAEAFDQRDQPRGYDQLEVGRMEAYDPPEPNEEMFWRKTAGAGKLRK